MRRGRFFWPAMALVTTFIVLTAAAVGYADVISLDGDTAVPSANISYGTGPGDLDCATRGATVPGAVGIAYNGSQHYVAGETLTVTLTPDDPGITATADAAQIPTGWGSTATSYSFDIHTTVSTSVTGLGHKVTIKVHGDNSGYEAGSGPSGSGRPQYIVNVDCGSTVPTNGAPSVEAGGPYSGEEGSNIAIDGASASDPDNDTLIYAWTYDDSAIDGGGSCTLTSASTLSPTLNCNDNGTVTLTLTVDDNHGHTPFDTATVNVANVNPAASGLSFSYNNLTGKGSASFNFSDAGTNDTHTASFSWSDATLGSLGTTNATVTESGGAGSASATDFGLNLPGPGCYSLTVTGTANDDDGGSGSVNNSSSPATVDIYAVGFAPPIMDNVRNVVKYRNVVPVKVRITSSCSGLLVTSYSLFIRTVAGNVGGTDEGTDVVTTSVSNADTGSQMRLADGMYIYNYATSNLTAGQDYTIQIRLGSTTGLVLITGVIQPKK
jgi:hypothetical protein